MRSPFPGMDPWMELHWRDVHARLIIYIADQLQSQLPEPLVARANVMVDNPRATAGAAATYCHSASSGRSRRGA